MFGFNITELVTDTENFTINSSFGKWEFTKNDFYNDLLPDMDKGKCGNTFVAYHSEASERMSNEQFENLCDEIIDICLILSFITSRCVTVSGSAPFSCPSFIELGDNFIRSRAIRGLDGFDMNHSFTDIFTPDISNFQNRMKARNLRIFLSHWISGLTCYTIEDLFLANCVSMDIVKQCEKLPSDGRDYYFYNGMERASNRYSIPKLNRDYTKMRNDLVHEGTLSGKNNKNKSKEECSQIIADVLNWIDEYVLKVLNLESYFDYGSRWNGININNFLPSISLDR